MADSYGSILPRPGPDGCPVNRGVEPSQKRQTVALACQRCRWKKVKCDGLRPNCGACVTKQADCQYNDDPENTTHANLIRAFRRLEKQQRELAEVFDMLKTRPQAEADVIYRHLRLCTDVKSLLSLVKDGDMIADLHSSIERRPSDSREQKIVLAPKCNSSRLDSTNIRKYQSLSDGHYIEWHRRHRTNMPVGVGLE